MTAAWFLPLVSVLNIKGSTFLLDSQSSQAFLKTMTLKQMENAFKINVASPFPKATHPKLLFPLPAGSSLHNSSISREASWSDCGGALVQTFLANFGQYLKGT